VLPRGSWGDHLLRIDAGSVSQDSPWNRDGVQSADSDVPTIVDHLRGTAIGLDRELGSGVVRNDYDRLDARVAQSVSARDDAFTFRALCRTEWVSAVELPESAKTTT